MSQEGFNKQAAIDSSMENGVVDIDKLLSCNDFEIIKEGLSNYPLTINEYLDERYKQGDYRTIYRWAIDHDANVLADYLVTNVLPSTYHFGDKIKDTDDLIDHVVDKLRRNGTKFINDKYFYGQNVTHLRYGEIARPSAIKEKVVSTIINDLALKLDKKTITAGLTREYFDDLFTSGNYELLVIKLCVRLEAILKSDFHYQGTFEEMLSQYSKEHGYHDVDDGGYITREETEQNKIFHKLRKYRNDIVHAEKQQEKLSLDQLKLAIEYVFKLG